MEEEETKNISEKGNSMLLRSKQRYEVLDGLRGIASLIVIIFHFFELYFLGKPQEQIINHGYLAVDFFYVLSGFVIGYAYDDRWDRMSLWDFYKRRLIRLHPMVIAGSLLGVCYFYLGESSASPYIKNAKPYYFFLNIIMNFLMIPTPVDMDIRGWSETFPFNSPNWTLFYEYLINIIYSLLLRRLHTIVIGLMTFTSSLLIINLAFNIDIFNVMQERIINKYTMIGGWSLTSCELYIGFTRLLYPFLSGYLIYRLKLKIKLPYSFIICSVILTICLCSPRVETDDYPILNGIYEAFVIIIIFPIIIMIGAGDNTKNKIILKICNIMGEFSYPVYITHYSIIYLNAAWTSFHMNDRLYNKIMVSIGSFFIIIFNSYALIELYDKPVRKWLSDKFIVKRYKKEENDNKMNYNRINDSVIDNDYDKKNIGLNDEEDKDRIEGK